MAQLMADSDLAISAAGATSWERCCLGLPSILVVVAENQRLVGRNLDLFGAALQIGTAEIDGELLSERIGIVEKKIKSMSDASANVTSGRGSALVLHYLMGGAYER
ncbi:hypothetical protein GCM10011348_33020 [Marinobacterium nitratireducens]|uniref:Glycosyl transferase family 28 C-terminal domain-containing protein n=2 Tax=Marinobacterium nitratireducens TaxID=518897 RepID=A0A917ZMR6_9GAMM|nr:hypothetical protein GCM10011348_33020 [Marinobacterium nitratireducens]